MPRPNYSYPTFLVQASPSLASCQPSKALQRNCHIICPLHIANLVNRIFSNKLQTNFTTGIHALAITSTSPLASYSLYSLLY